MLIISSVFRLCWDQCYKCIHSWLYQMVWPTKVLHLQSASQRKHKGHKVTHVIQEMFLLKNAAKPQKEEKIKYTTCIWIALVCYSLAGFIWLGISRSLWRLSAEPEGYWGIAQTGLDKRSAPNIIGADKLFNPLFKCYPGNKWASTWQSTPPNDQSFCCRQ